MAVIVGNLLQTDVVTDTLQTPLNGAAGVTTLQIGGRVFVYVMSALDDSLSVYELDGDGQLTLIENHFNSALNRLDGARQTLTAEIGGQTYLYASAVGSDAVNVYAVNADTGGLTFLESVIDQGTMALNGLYGRLDIAEVDGTHFLIVPGYDDDGISIFELGANGRLASNTHNFNAANLDAVYGIKAIEIDGTDYFLASAVGADTVSVYEIDALGQASFVSSVVDAGSLELDGPIGIETAVLGGVHYVFVAGYFDDGISVFSMSAAGTLTNVFNQPDTGAMGLDGARDLDIIELAGEHFLSVTGTVDDDITFFHISDNGTLNYLSAASSSALNGALRLASATINDIGFLVASGYDGDGLSAYEIGGGNDGLVATAGEDLVLGFRGNDAITANTANATGDIYDGGDGFDYLYSGGSTTTVHFDFFAGEYRDLGAGSVALIYDFEGAVGGSGDDLFIGGHEDNIFYTGAGADSAYGRGGDDDFYILGSDNRLFGEDGNDTFIFQSISSPTSGHELYGGAGIDTFDGRALGTGPGLSINVASSIEIYYGADYGNLWYGGPEDNELYGAGGNDELYGNFGDDFIEGGTGDDDLYGGDGDDIIYGNSGNDDIYAGAGADEIYGGPGSIDNLFFTSFANNVVNLMTGVGSAGDAAGDTYEGIERVYGGSGSDTIRGDNAGNIINGNDGDDVLSDGAGGDAMYGGAGDDLFYIDGAQGDWSGLADIFDGGAGNDTLQVLFWNLSSYTIDLAAGLIRSNISSTTATIANFENYDGTLLSTASGETVYGTAGANILRTGSGANTILAGDGNDLVAAGAGDDVIDGGGGDDIVYGEAGGDTLYGGAGDDVLDGGEGMDIVDGAAGIDTLTYDSAAGGVAVSLDAGTGTLGDANGDLIVSIENLTGSAFDDVLIGSAGSNVIIGGAGADAMDALGGYDVLDYSGASGAIYIHLNLNIGRYFEAEGDTFAGFEELHGSVFGDTLIGSTSIDTILGQNGDDILRGLAGDDTLIGGAGNDELFGEGGNDMLFGGTGDDILHGSNGLDIIDGEAGSDTLAYLSSALAVNVNLATNAFIGGDADGDTVSGIENLIGSALDDTLFGDAQDNRIEGAAGSDFMAGGDGFDEISYASSASAVSVNLDTQVVSGGHAAGDTISGFEGALGSGFDDELRGSSLVNILYGLAGADRILGGDGDDLIYGGAGEDIIYGQNDDDEIYGDDGADQITGGLGNDAVYGGAENDFINGQGGNDALFGGAGDDELFGASGNDQMNGGDGLDVLASGGGDDTVDGGDGADVINAGLGFDLVFGGNGEDDILGGSQDDELYGGAGIDDISGNQGNDLIYGGADDDDLGGERGADEIYGGDGNDAIAGGSNGDTLFGDAGLDVLLGDGGNDFLYGGLDVDTLNGGSGADDVFGGDGNDLLIGGGGGDDLFGGDGADVLSGGASSDNLTGGLGADIFDMDLGFGVDRIKDFENGADLIDFSGNSLANNFAAVLAKAAQIGANIRIELNGNNTLILESVLLADLDATDFIF